MNFNNVNYNGSRELAEKLLHDEDTTVIELA